MKDNFGRTIDYLRLSVTDRCNSRCIYCMPEQGVAKCTHAEVLSYEEIAELVSAAAKLGVHKVRLTGGEPLVRRGIVELVRMVAATEGIDEVDMTTNATLLSPIAKDLKEAGLTRLNISLDTLDPERYAQISRTAKLEDALAGLAAAEAAGFVDTKINCVLMGGVNTCDIRPIAELAKDHAYEVRFIELMRMGECASWPAECFVPAERVLEEVPELKPAGNSGVAELYQAPGWMGHVGLIRPVTHKFCSSCNRVRITSDGKLKPCLHSSEELMLRGLEGQALYQALADGMRRKPQQHHISKSNPSSTPRRMNQIGGLWDLHI